jgi:FtsZ-interacting cell division protein YlmF
VARKGDLIVVDPRRVGGPAREGEVIEVIEGDLRVQYRVRWNDGHESLFAPGAGAARIEPPRGRKRTRSEGTEPKKSPAKASTARKSTAKKSTAKTTTTKKSAATKSTVRKVASKKAASRGPSVRR